MRASLLRTLLAIGLAAAVPSAPALAQDAFPSKPLKLVVPLPAGGPTDALARATAQSLSRTLGQPVVVENRPGADGAIAARAVAAAPADGHTLLFSIGSMIATPLMSSPPAFDWLGELAPVGGVGRLSFCLMIHPDVPAATVSDLVAYARANPGKLSFATSTNSELMAAAQFMRATGITMNRVPYKGGMQALPDLLAGRIQVNFGPVSIAQTHARDGKLRVLATLLPRRSPVLPDVPTIAEAGFPSVDVPTWQALFAPAKTPASVLARLAADLAAATQDAELRAELERRAVYAEPTSPQQLRALVTTEQSAWSRLIDDYKLAGQ